MTYWRWFISMAAISSCIVGVYHCAKASVTNDLERVLAWLPRDIETICAVNGPFIAPPPLEPSVDAPAEPLSLRLQRSIFGVCLPSEIYSPFAGKTVLLAVEGSRNFETSQASTNLYDGVHICLFKEPIRDELTKYLLANFCTSEGGIWTDKTKKSINWNWPMQTFLAIPTDNCVILSTKVELLRDVLRRADGRSARSTMDTTLPEWRYVDKNAQFWAMRHFAKSTKDVMAKHILPDDQAIGLVFQYEPLKSKFVQVIYLSNNPDAAKLLEERVLPMVTPTGTKPDPSRTKRLDKIAVQLRLSVETQDQLQRVLVFSLAMLGHSLLGL